MITVGAWTSKGHKSRLLTLFPVFPQAFLWTLQNAIRTEQSQEDAIWHSRVFSFYLQRNTTGTVCSYSEIETKSLRNIFSASQPVPHLSVSRRERKQMEKKDGKEKQSEFGHRKKPSAKTTEKKMTLPVPFEELVAIHCSTPVVGASNSNSTTFP